MNWLWRGFLAAGQLTLLTSLWKSGKTTLLAVLLSRMKEGPLWISPQRRGQIKEGSPGRLVSFLASRSGRPRR